MNIILKVLILSIDYLVLFKLLKKYNNGENSNINYYYFFGNFLTKEKEVEDEFKLYYKILYFN